MLPLSSRGEGGIRSPNRKPRYRAARLREMKAAGTTPCRKQWVWCVEPGRLKGLYLPEWAREAAVRGLAQQDDKVWLWGGDAKRLIGQDRSAGGKSKVTRAELRHCGVCGRPMVGAEAAKRREFDESGPQGRKTPCGEMCGRDRASRVWVLAGRAHAPGGAKD